MYKIKLSQAELAKLNKKKKQEKNTKMYHRLQSVYLAHKGRDNKEIVDILGVNKNSVTKWIKIYCEKGINELCEPINYDRRSAKIDKYINKIKQDIKDNTISTLSELQDWLSKKYSLEMEQSWLFRCCKKKLIYLTKKRV